MNCPRCGELINDHEAGRATDACVSEVVLGWKIRIEKSGAQKRYWLKHPNTGNWALPLHEYSSDWGRAGRLLKLIRELDPFGYFARFVDVIAVNLDADLDDSHGDAFNLLGNLTPLEICKAALEVGRLQDRRIIQGDDAEEAV